MLLAATGKEWAPSMSGSQASSPSRDSDWDARASWVPRPSSQGKPSIKVFPSPGKVRREISAPVDVRREAGAAHAPEMQSDNARPRVKSREIIMEYTRIA